jgi:DNA repair protein RadC
MDRTQERPMIISTSLAAFRYLKPIGLCEVEEFWVMALHSNKRVIQTERVFRGTVDACPIFPRDVFRIAVRLNASSIIVAHNHPSGDVEPSEQDIAITRRLLKASEVLAIPVIDHLIIAGEIYKSFADSGLLGRHSLIGTAN